MILAFFMKCQCFTDQTVRSSAPYKDIKSTISQLSRDHDDAFLSAGTENVAF